MTTGAFHAVFLHPGALEALGAAIQPYLSEGPLGKHVVCREIDSGGAFFGMKITGTANDGHPIELELLIPTNMVLMVLSAHGEGAFGFQQGSDAPASTPAIHKGGAANATSGAQGTAQLAATPKPPAAGDPLSSIEG